MSKASAQFEYLLSNKIFSQPDLYNDSLKQLHLSSTELKKLEKTIQAYQKFFINEYQREHWESIVINKDKKELFEDFQKIKPLFIFPSPLTYVPTSDEKAFCANYHPDFKLSEAPCYEVFFVTPDIKKDRFFHKTAKEEYNVFWFTCHYGYEVEYVDKYKRYLPYKAAAGNINKVVEMLTKPKHIPANSLYENKINSYVDKVIKNFNKSINNSEYINSKL